ncbi:hypothetical protein [Celeribacter neptunius]|uniref:Uncharacterized protein n=1 Tax=Celeribacter neptunius TaxID=588602 RepID=A0A1I3WV17_9RHOB|nr:hypothetical protein [Celeribacter neptunius]SFK11342.1 hypothetical protein SAMN04487991_3862 [Celeribacter neptunius]
MIKLVQSAGDMKAAKAAILFNGDMEATLASVRPANHNLTHEARGSNVVLLGGHSSNPDFRPDLGARLALAA